MYVQQYQQHGLPARATAPTTRTSSSSNSTSSLLLSSLSSTPSSHSSLLTKRTSKALIINSTTSKENFINNIKSKHKQVTNKLNVCKLCLIVLLTICHTVQITNAYLIIVHENTPPGAVIFNASVYKLGSERHYKINAHKSAYFVHHLVAVNHKDGQIQLKKSLKCDGIYYPNLFTFYVDSTSNRLRSIDYYSLPVRIFISGHTCNEDRRVEEEIHARHYEEEDSSYLRRRKKRGNT